MIAYDIPASENIIINPKDDIAMAHAVIDILSSPEEHLIKSKKAREFAQKKLSWDVITKQTIDIYQNLDWCCLVRLLQ